jgi:4'-phosphopantetheinyl transferase EntD
MPVWYEAVMGSIASIGMFWAVAVVYRDELAAQRREAQEAS